MTRGNVPVLVSCIACVSACANAAVLYDAGNGTLPGAPVWTYQVMTNPPGGAIETTQSVGGGVTTLDSTAEVSEYAGCYTAWPLIDSLDRAAGYTVGLSLRIREESHLSDDRAGFSVIVLSSDLQGIELGFWADCIWAQNDSPIFTHGEQADYDTTAAMVRYDLAILDDAYSLWADGSRILSGSLRDYTAWSGPIDPYETPSFLFFGDDTSSACAQSEIALIELLDYPVPEPACLAILGLAAMLHLGRCSVRLRAP